MEFSLSRCGNPKCKRAPHSYVHLLLNKLLLAIRRHIQLYYAVKYLYRLCHFFILIIKFISLFQGWLVCEDRGCATRTRRLPLKSSRAYPVCVGCGNSNMDLEVNLKIFFFMHIAKKN